jgi:lysine 2,3-aminomutase
MDCNVNNLGPENPRFNDWLWQLQNSIKTMVELKKYLPNLPLPDDHGDNVKKISLPFLVTPYFASLMKPDGNCPLFDQLIPKALELDSYADNMTDPLGEEEREVVPFLIHRYPDRVLFLAHDRCASYCRFCMRKRLVGQGPSPQPRHGDEAFKYISEHQEIREIIFSGGDPLILSTPRLSDLLKRSFAIPHIHFVRIHTRMLAFAPMRVDDQLCEELAQCGPLYIVAHFNHPNEITTAAELAIKKLQRAGVVVLNQSVLLKGINDEEAVLEELWLKLAKNKVRPYYLHQCDVINGARHFRVPINRALQIMENLRGRISGIMMPTLMIDIPGGHGKVVMSPNVVAREDETHIYLRGFKGGVASYPKD